VFPAGTFARAETRKGFASKIYHVLVLYPRFPPNLLSKRANRHDARARPSTEPEMVGITDAIRETSRFLLPACPQTSPSMPSRFPSLYL
jgi:hypothetical protein